VNLPSKESRFRQHCYRYHHHHHFIIIIIISSTKVQVEYNKTE